MLKLKYNKASFMLYKKCLPFASCHYTIWSYYPPSMMNSDNLINVINIQGGLIIKLLWLPKTGYSC